MLTPELLFLAQICIKSFFSWGFAPDPILELIALSRPASCFWEGWSPGKRKRKWKGKKKREGREEKEGEG